MTGVPRKVLDSNDAGIQNQHDHVCIHMPDQLYIMKSLSYIGIVDLLLILYTAYFT